MALLLIFLIPVIPVYAHHGASVLEEGIFYKHLNIATDKYAGFTKSLYKGSGVYLTVENCKGSGVFNISWMMGYSECEGSYQSVSEVSGVNFDEATVEGNDYIYYKSKPQQVNCNKLEPLKDESNGTWTRHDMSVSAPHKDKTKQAKVKDGRNNASELLNRIMEIPFDGRYMLIVQLEKVDKESKFNVKVKVEMKSSSGYLSAVQWPLLPFYGVMCAVYSILAFVWLVLLGYNWKDPLKIQFWIFGAILIGLLESIVMYNQYKQVNHTGVSSSVAIFIAQWVSCIKYTSTKLLLLVVSMGYGIIRSSLGKTLHWILGAGFAYFFLCLVEGCLSVYGHHKLSEIANLPLFISDVMLCWWILRKLLGTLQQLKLRKNLAKLWLYKCLAGVTVIGIICNIIYLMWSTDAHQWTACVTKWRCLWWDDAYWSISNCVLQITIMALIRPTAHYRHYQFTLLNDTEDEDEEMQQPTSSDAFESIKMRSMAEEKKTDENKNSPDEASKWVEENLQDAFADAFLGTSDTKKEHEAMD